MKKWLWHWRWMIISLGMPLAAWAFVHIFEPSDHTRDVLAIGFALLALCMLPLVIVRTVQLNRSIKRALEAMRELQRHAEAGTLPPPPPEIQAMMRRTDGDVG